MSDIVGLEWPVRITVNKDSICSLLLLSDLHQKDMATDTGWS